MHFTAEGRTNVELYKNYYGMEQRMAAFTPKRATDEPTKGPVTKIREKTERSMPMSSTAKGSARGSQTSLVSGGHGELRNKKGERTSFLQNFSRPRPPPALRSVQHRERATPAATY